MAEEEPLATLILEILRRKRRATLWEIIREIYAEPKPSDIERIRNLLRRLEIAGAVFRREEAVRGPVKRYIYYDIRPLRRLVARRPGRMVTEREMSQILGIPLAEIPRVLELAVTRGWLRTTPTVGVYQVPERIYRVQKMRAWRTRHKEWNYMVKLGERMKIPRQLVLDGYAPSEESAEMSTGVHGACRVVVYTTAPERWPEERLERIMRGLFAQEGITLEIFSDRPYIEKDQAYEAEEVDIDEKPPELDIDEPDVWLWVAKEEGYTYVYHYTRRPWGWEYERYTAK
jgi:hypothetical protein